MILHLTTPVRMTFLESDGPGKPVEAEPLPVEGRVLRLRCPALREARPGQPVQIDAAGYLVLAEIEQIMGDTATLRVRHAFAADVLALIRAPWRAPVES